jgi:hypothetical protein
MSKETGFIWEFLFIKGNCIYMKTDSVDAKFTVKKGLNPQAVLFATFKELN